MESERERLKLFILTRFLHTNRYPLRSKTLWDVYDNGVEQFKFLGRLFADLAASWFSEAPQCPGPGREGVFNGYLSAALNAGLDTGTHSRHPQTTVPTCVISAALETYSLHVFYLPHCGRIPTFMLAVYLREPSAGYCLDSSNQEEKYRGEIRDYCGCNACHGDGCQCG
jgi:hypothetical protein